MYVNNYFRILRLICLNKVHTR